MAWHNYRRNTKYHNTKTIIDGEAFDSRKEARRYAELKMLMRAGMVYDLQRQVKFVLIPSQRDKKTGKVIERECAYYADFVYWDKTGRQVVEDVKSPATRTKDYIIKRKLMLFSYGIHITEI